MALVWVALRLREWIQDDPAVPEYEISVMDIVLLSALAVGSILYLIYHEYKKREEVRKNVFPFMRLYAEPPVI